MMNNDNTTAKKNERLVTIKLRENTKKKLQLIKAYLVNSDDMYTQKIGKSDYAVLAGLVEKEYERVKQEFNNIVNDPSNQ